MSGSRKRQRRGGALIEVCVALVLLATAGTGLITLLGQTSHTIRDTRETERTLRRAGSEIDRLAILDQRALVARVGMSTARGFVVAVEAIDAELFDVRVSAIDTDVPLLATILYRPRADSAHAQ